MVGGVFHVTSGRRSYSPELGRWVNRDPIGEEGGWNLLILVENDPIELYDILGLITHKFKGSWTQEEKHEIKHFTTQIQAGLPTLTLSLQERIKFIDSLPDSCPLKVEFKRGLTDLMVTVGSLNAFLKSNLDLKLKKTSWKHPAMPVADTGIIGHLPKGEEIVAHKIRFNKRVDSSYFDLNPSGRLQAYFHELLHIAGLTGVDDVDPFADPLLFKHWISDPYDISLKNLRSSLLPGFPDTPEGAQDRCNYILKCGTAEAWGQW